MLCDSMVLKWIERFFFRTTSTYIIFTQKSLQKQVILFREFKNEIAQ